MSTMVVDTKWLEIVQKCSLTARGTPLTPRTPPHSLWQVPVATPGLRGVRLSSWSHPEPSFPRTAASPVRSDCFAPVGVQVIHEPATPVRLCRTASGACLIKYSCQPCCAGVCLAPHHRHHVARRSATTLAAGWLACWCTIEKHAAQAEPSLPEPARTTD